MVKYLFKNSTITALIGCLCTALLSAQPEQHRPLFHFTPPTMWMNDPNGMFFIDGEYHLFYQHYPDGMTWGPMHWGHAVSRDLTYWRHLPIALYPDSLGMIFSGSAVVDRNNTSGFGKDGIPPVVAIFTHHDMAGEKAGRSDFQTQSIAFSTDRGQTWTKYAGNPVVSNAMKIRDFRDPKVIWDEASRQWVMVLAAQDRVQFWGSPNLKDWQYLSDFGRTSGAHTGVWECPDLFPIPVEGGASAERKWVLLQSINPGAPGGGSGTQYFVGHFDGKNFTLDPGFAGSVKDGRAVWLDWGRDNYAGVTWSDVPVTDGRRLFMGWMSNWDYANRVPTPSWRSAMTLPRSLTLRKTPAGYRLFAQPVQELAALREKTIAIKPQKLSGIADLTAQYGVSPEAFEIELTLEWRKNTRPDFAVILSNAKGEEYRVGIDVGRNIWYSDRTRSGKVDFSDKFAKKIHEAPRTRATNSAQLRLFFDVASCELFADGGETALTDIFFPSENFNLIRIAATNGTVKIKSGKLYPLRPVFSVKH